MRTAVELDSSDPLATYRERFVGAETELVYFDGNSLGRPLRATGDRLKTFVVDKEDGSLHGQAATTAPSTPPQEQSQASRPWLEQQFDTLDFLVAN